MPKSKESLPAGVGRVPAWWMELTPHYVLDVEDDEQQRKMMVEQEALYYAQMAANDDGRLAREWKSSWGGRANNGGGADGDGGSALFGGRNFQPGSVGWDPREWGVDPNDPDYMSYLKGAKLPQSYIDAMMEFAGQVGINYDASALKSTNGPGYGSSGGRPAFTPAWAKKKLRSTGQGAAIRHGIYDDSPNKFSNKHRVNAHMTPKEDLPATPNLQEQAQEESVPTPEAEPAPAPVAPPAPAPAPPPPQPKWKPPAPTPKPANFAPVEHSYAPAPVRSNTRAPPPPGPQDLSVDKPKYNFNDYYYNAGASPTPVKPVMPEQPKAMPAAPEQAPPQPQDVEEEYEEVVEYVEEYEDGAEGEEYEEIVEEYVEEEPAAVAPQSANLTDLQALLAQKQAELAKLQGM